MKRALRRLGLDVRYAAPHRPLEVQKRILAGTDVRTIVDGGAHTGEWTRYYREAFPGATVLAFEPFPACLEQLRSEFATDPKVTMVEQALGETVGTRTFYCNKLAATNSLLPADPAIRGVLPDPNWVAPDSEMSVPVTTLDDYCLAAGIERVNILKLDIQGAELLALRGAAGLLARGAIDLVYSELLFHPHYQGQAQHFEVCEFLHRFNYGLYGIYELAVNRSGRMWQGDGIFVRGRG